MNPLLEVKWLHHERAGEMETKRHWEEEDLHSSFPPVFDTAFQRPRGNFFPVTNRLSLKPQGRPNDWSGCRTGSKMKKSNNAILGIIGGWTKDQGDQKSLSSPKFNPFFFALAPAPACLPRPCERRPTSCHQCSVRLKRRLREGRDGWGLSRLEGSFFCMSVHLLPHFNGFTLMFNENVAPCAGDPP